MTNQPPPYRDSSNQPLSHQDSSNQPLSYQDSTSSASRDLELIRKFKPLSSIEHQSQNPIPSVIVMTSEPSTIEPDRLCVCMSDQCMWKIIMTAVGLGAIACVAWFCWCTCGGFLCGTQTAGRCVGGRCQDCALICPCKCPSAAMLSRAVMQ